mgnify:FL=1
MQLEKGQSPCPTEWRTPNLREGALMYLYSSSTDWWDGDTNNTDNNAYTLVSTYTSLGIYGNNRKDGKKSWFFGYDFASLDGNSGSAKVRCVKDSDPATW